jgi:hypothetical protein
MKKLLVVLAVSCFTYNSFAQKDDKEEQHGFKRENVFVGGSIALGLGSNGFIGGANPQVGYSIAKWLDAGITTNIIYSSQRDPYYDIRQKAVNYGIGPFIRICPVSIIHLQAQYEFNWTNGSVTDLQSGNKIGNFNVSAPSLLVGAGYGRRIVGSTFFYTTLLFDVTKNANSPYVYVEGNTKTSLPVIRAGFNVYLHRRNEK